MIEDFNWRRLAACKTQPPDMFFPHRGYVDNTEAKALCETCPVKAACKAEAMADLDLIGIWGGLTHKERVHLAGKKSHNSRRSLAVHVQEVVGVPRPVPAEFYDEKQYKLEKRKYERRLARFGS